MGVDLQNAAAGSDVFREDGLLMVWSGRSYGSGIFGEGLQ